MSIFGGSGRFPDDPVRSPGPVYGRVEIKSKGNTVVMKRNCHPVDETRKWGKRESWIGGSNSSHIPVVAKVESHLAPGHYETNVEAVKSQAPKVSFPKSNRFLSQKVNVTDRGHERELMAADSPGPKYNVGSLASNGGKAVSPGYSFAQPSPESRTRLPNVDSPRRGHRESWLSVINRNGVLVMPASPASTPRTDLDGAPIDDANNIGAKNTGTAFGNEHRFGFRQEKAKSVNSGIGGGRRVQFVSAKHTRENMGEFSPGPIYAPYNPDCPGGRLAPSPRTARREPPPGSPKDGVRNPHANLNSRSSWLAGNVRKTDGVETVLMRTGDVPPGPGSYGDPSSSFAKVSHNVKAKGVLIKPTRPSPRPPPSPSQQEGAATRKITTREASLRTPEPTSPAGGL